METSRRSGRPQRRAEVEGIVVNQFQARASLPQKLVQELRAKACRCSKPPVVVGQGEANRTSSHSR
jgi:hypothetical protein